MRAWHRFLSAVGLAPDTTIPNAERGSRLTSDARYGELDGLRGFAALAVFFGHFVWEMLPQGHFLQTFNCPLACTPIRLIWGASSAVILLFVLSGFVLALPYVRYARKLIYAEFAIRRIFRIYPLYLVAVALSVILQKYVFQPDGLIGLSQRFNDLWHSPWSLGGLVKAGLLIGPAFDTQMINPAVWALVVEMKASLLYPAFIFLLCRFRSVRGSLALLAASFVLAFILAGPFPLPREGRTILQSTPIGWPPYYFLPMFVLGGVLAQYLDDLVALCRRAGTFTFLAILVGAIILYAVNLDTPFYLAPYVTAVGSAMLFVLAIAGRGFGRTLKTWPFQFVGRVSYGVYLLHYSMLLSLASILYPLLGNVYLVLLAAFVITVTLSYFLHRFIEEPFASSGRRVGAWAAASLPFPRLGAFGKPYPVKGK